MSLTIRLQMANKENYGGLRLLSDIKYIVVHYTANDGDTAQGNVNYFQNNIVNASAHYFVDDKEIIQSVPDHFIAYSVGGKKYNNTKGGTLYNVATNRNTLNIELCDSVKNGVSDFTANTLLLSMELIKKLMKTYNVPIERVIRHYDVTGKLCPKPFVDDEKWDKFRRGLIDTRYDKIAELPDWAKPTIQKLVNEGKIADGNNLDLSIDMIRVLVILNR